MSNDIDYDELNHTELLLIAKELNPDVSRNTPRNILIQVLENEPGKEPEIPKLKANKRRLTIMDFIIKNWAMCGALVDCPAKSLDKHACFQCLDLQVTECWEINKHTISGKKEA